VEAVRLKKKDHHKAAKVTKKEILQGDDEAMSGVSSRAEARKKHLSASLSPRELSLCSLWLCVDPFSSMNEALRACRVTD
jgi:hypothetical protein